MRLLVRQVPGRSWGKRFCKTRSTLRILTEPVRRCIVPGVELPALRIENSQSDRFLLFLQTLFREALPPVEIQTADPAIGDIGGVWPTLLDRHMRESAEHSRLSIEWMEILIAAGIRGFQCVEMRLANGHAGYLVDGLRASAFPQGG